MLQHLLESGLRQTMTRLVRPLLHPAIPLSLQRTLVAQAYRSSVPPRDCVFHEATLGGMPITRASCGGSKAGTLVYLHGGGFVFGSDTTHRGIIGHLAKTSGCEVIAPDYRLAPEHPFPAALEDAEAVYKALLDDGVKADQIALAGDSAGAGLSISLAMKLRDQNVPLPSSLTLFSPLVDLTHQQMYVPENEPVLQARWLERNARHYGGNEPLTNPLISPIFGDLSGLPPLLIQVGSDEILLNDAQRLANKAKRQDVPTTLEIFNSLWHVFQIHAGQLTRATEALQGAGAHIKCHLAN
ncbi:alpha/beta hydrolase [Marinobacter salinisoli]|uniref:Alpha/beta hydrolase n=1 Tax=Marinobacter salinisoli TaxID=2769486 RepID=A0ABX7MQL9_9GAMM|nr:alpha/beta hydrolase [Marinobacter salinisoli]QSP94627.1 alpha/beta hydrolase [Marinobacter salinisoli]